jgi:hypothetical protein
MAAFLLCAVLPLLHATAAGAPATASLAATLNPATSAQPGSVAEVVQASLPAKATWLRLRPMDATIHVFDWPCGHKCWYPVTKPKDKHKHQHPVGIQQ